MANNERPYTGLTAEVKINDVPIAYISGIDLSLEKSIIEVLQFGARYQEKVPAIKNWTATADGTVAFAPGGSQKKLYDAFENDEEVTLGVFLDDFSYFEGYAYISNLNINGAPDDKMNLTCDFEGNGGIAFTLPPTYNIKVSSGVGGTVTPGGITRVAQAGGLELTITAAPNYEIDDVTDNGVDVTDLVTAGKYALTGVVVDHIITVAFKSQTAADKSMLRAALNFANTLVEADYTSGTWSTLETAATAASTVSGNVSATQTNVDEAYSDLVEAIEALVRA